MIEVFVLCRSQAYIERWEKHAEVHPGVDFKLRSGYTSYYKFILDALDTATTENPIICHDDVWFGVGFFRHIPILLTELAEYAPNWGVIGNAGIDVRGETRYRYIRDPHDGPSKSAFCKPVAGVDGNTMMINKANFIAHKVDLPDLGGFHGYDMLLSLECLRSGLLPMVDHRLAVYHESKGDGKSFFEFIAKEEFKRYVAERFINHSIPNINGTIHLSSTSNYSYLKLGGQGNRQDIAELFDTALLSSRAIRKPSVTIMCRTQFNRPALLTRAILSFAAAIHQTRGLMDLRVCIVTDQTQSQLDIELKRLNALTSGISLSGKALTVRPPRYSRADLLVHAIEGCDTDYVWFVDDDDYVFPNAVVDIARCLPANGTVFLTADCMRYEEEWPDTANSHNTVPLKSNTINRTFGNQVLLSFSGDNFVPVCGCIFPVRAMKYQVEGMEILGDYSEDYFLLMLALCAPKVEVVMLETVICGISIRGQENTVTVKDRSPWNSSYATFMTELLNSEKTGSPAFWLLAKPTPQMLRGLIAKARFDEYPRFIRMVLHGCYSLIAIKEAIMHPHALRDNFTKCLYVLRRGGIRQLITKISQFGQNRS